MSSPLLKSMQKAQPLGDMLLSRPVPPPPQPLVPSRKNFIPSGAGGGVQILLGKILFFWFLKKPGNLCHHCRRETKTLQQDEFKFRST